MEEVRARAVEGFYKLARGGVEVAGILIGEQDGDTIRIVAQQPFEIEYAYGPMFMLSPRDHAFLRKLVDDVRESSAPAGRKVLGFYVSHSRGELSVKEIELGLFKELFPHDWQTILLLKPSRAPETPAAFFVREPDGEVRANRSHMEFEIAPDLGERRVRAERAPRPQDESLRALASASTRAEPDPVPAIRRLGGDPQPPAALRHGQQVVEDPESPSSAPMRANQVAAERQLPAERRLPSERTELRDGENGRAATDPQLAGQQLSGPGPAHESDQTAFPPVAGNRSPANHQTSAHAGVANGFQDSDAGFDSNQTASPVASTVSAVASAGDAGTTRGAWEDEQPRAPRASSPLRIAIPAAALLFLAVLGYLVYLALNAVPPKIVFYTQETDGRMEVVWQLSGIRDATSAQIIIENRGERKTIDLIRMGQLSGSLTDALLTPEALVTLSVERSTAPGILRVAPMLASDSPVASLQEIPVPSLTAEAGTEDGSNPPELEPEIAPTPEELEALAAAAASVEAARAEMASVATAATAATAAEAQRTAVPAAESTPAPSSQRTADPPAPALASGSGSSSIAGTRGSSPVQGQENPAPTAVARAAELGGGRGGVDAPSSSATPPGTVTQSPPPQTQPAQSQVAPPPSPASPPVVPQPTSPVPVVAGSSRSTPAAARPPAPVKPVAGRLIWTGQLRKNQVLQINGRDANQGAVNAGLPGQPVRLNVLPGELTSQGLVVYTANPRFRDAASSVEAAGPTNGWNQTRYRYDPVRANSLIVTAIPNQTNRWQGITVRNDDKPVNVIVIDWLAETD